MLTDSSFYVELSAENRFPISLTDFELFQKIYKIYIFFCFWKHLTPNISGTKGVNLKNDTIFVKYTFSATTYYEISKMDFPKFFEKTPRHHPVDFVKNRNLSDRN